jgi:hypothetical protein
MSVYLYKKVDLTKITFDKTPYEKYVEFKTIFYIDISYKEDCLYIQIPKSKIVSFDMESKIAIIEITKDFYNLFIKKLEEIIINKVYKYSTRWFNGKQFTMNKIQKCFISNVNNNHLYLTIDKDPFLYDQFRNIQTLELLSTKDANIVCIVKLLNLQFMENRFTYNLVLEQAKIYRKSEVKEYSIIESTSTNKDVSSSSCSEKLKMSLVKEPVSSSSELEDEYYKE